MLNVVNTPSPIPGAPGHPIGGRDAPRAPIKATPFEPRDHRLIPPRRWVYGHHYIRGSVSATIAAGGTGKSSLAIVEALAMASGRDLLGVAPQERVRVWLWNGEDPIEELERRVHAAMIHFGIKPGEIAGWLFLDSGRTSPIVVTEQKRNGTEIAQSVIDDLEGTIRDRDIGVVILDPFVSVHRASENDNGAIDMVTKALAGVAASTECAIELIHHTRKTNGGEATVEDSRGAGALLATVRSARAINPMTDKEAAEWGVPPGQRRLYFRAYDGKANLAPPAGASKWFKLESVSLENSTRERPSDNVGVVTCWEAPKAFEGVTCEHRREVHQRVGEGEWRHSIQSRGWVGYLVAEVLGVDADDKAHRAKINRIIKSWLQNGVLRVEERQDPKSRKNVPFVAPGTLKEDTAPPQ